jgi:hypothetical protein
MSTPPAVSAEELRQSSDQGVLCWSQLPLWRRRVLEVLDDVVPRAANRQGFNRRDLRDPLTQDLLTERLSDVFHSVRAYHACSPSNVVSYYAEGLRPLSAASANKWIREFYLDGKFPELSAEDVEVAITSIGSDLRKDQIWFNLDDRCLTERCGHYLIYGSEYIMAVAAQLRHAGSPDYQRPLRGRGIPTVFACDIPLSICSEATIREFSQTVLEGIEDHRTRIHPPAKITDHGFSLRTLVPTYLISGHYHPEQVIDWRRRGETFDYRVHR